MSVSGRCWYRRIVLLAVCATLGGCTGSGVKAGGADSITGGVAIWLKASGEGGSHALYLVEPDGTLAFGGGFAAMREETTWQGTLSRDEAEGLRRVLTENDWFHGAPRPAADADGLPEQELRVHEIRFAWPGGSWQIETPLGGGQVGPVRAHLAELVTRKRHDEVFDQLPDAGPRR